MLGDARVRLVLLLAVFVALSAYALTTKTGLFFGGDSGSATKQDCPVDHQVPLAIVNAGKLRQLRREAASALPFRHLATYEEGPINLSNAWTDGEPGRVGVPEGGGPLGFELRWWTPSHDDLVIDVWDLPSAEAASDFVHEAASAKCRLEPIARATRRPSGARNLQWRNPDGFVQQDVYLSRGTRAYRVSIVRPGSEAWPSLFARLRAFAFVDAIAAGLPRADGVPNSGGELV